MKHTALYMLQAVESSRVVEITMEFDNYRIKENVHDYHASVHRDGLADDDVHQLCEKWRPEVPFTGVEELHSTLLCSGQAGVRANDSTVYLAEMEPVAETDPEVYEQFEAGNWVVSKRVQVPCCVVGEDHALEQVNCSMKVAGGERCSGCLGNSVPGHTQGRLAPREYIQ